MRRRIFALHTLPPLVLAVDTLVSVFARQRAGGGALAYYDDDFFYYLKIAINLAAGHGSTFDGIHPTNGYHPLWLLLLTGLCKLLPVQRVLLAVLGIICSSALATYGLALVCLKRVAQNEVLATLGAVFIAFGAMHIIYGGMEIVLTIPLALALCCFRIRPGFAWSSRTALLYGLLASLVVLSRLDTILLVGTLFLLELLWPQAMDWPLRARTAVSLAAGMLPVYLYAAINLRFFHVLMPISGMAKELRAHHAFSIQTVASLFAAGSLAYRLLIVAPAILSLLFAAGCLAHRGWKQMPVSCRPIALATMLVPLLQLVSLSWLSDWPLFEWYFYTFILAELGVGMVLLTQDFRFPRVSSVDLTAPAATVLVLLMAVDMASRLRSTKHPEDAFYSIYHGSVAIDDFARSHPGVYGMGDRAGMAGFMLPYPVVQLEGLVMDKPYLRNIREERNLVDVMRRYGIDYYVATDPEVRGGCYSLREPRQAGPDSDAMKATLCQEPVDHFVCNGKVTDIFVISGSSRLAPEEDSANVRAFARPPAYQP